METLQATFEVLPLNKAPLSFGRAESAPINWLDFWDNRAPNSLRNTTWCVMTNKILILQMLRLINYILVPVTMSFTLIWLLTWAMNGREWGVIVQSLLSPWEFRSLSFRYKRGLLSPGTFRSFVIFWSRDKVASFWWLFHHLYCHPLASQERVDSILQG